MQDARPWPNYDTDYRPMVQVAKHEGLPVICANAPRRYVSLAGGKLTLSATPLTSRPVPSLAALSCGLYPDGSTASCTLKIVYATMSDYNFTWQASGSLVIVLIILTQLRTETS